MKSEDELHSDALSTGLKPTSKTGSCLCLHRSPVDKKSKRHSETQLEIRLREQSRLVATAHCDVRAEVE